ncbi:hypothetical protein ACH518_06885 [Methylomonas sp. HW2-6]|uniref:hypothetical protein n=1 Tax=Methylomonas sp. HW2-6 TaxID=3376687 RepID=UPI004041B21D
MVTFVTATNGDSARKPYALATGNHRFGDSVAFLISDSNQKQIAGALEYQRQIVVVKSRLTGNELDTPLAAAVAIDPDFGIACALANNPKRAAAGRLAELQRARNMAGSMKCKETWSFKSPLGFALLYPDYGHAIEPNVLNPAIRKFRVVARIKQRGTQDRIKTQPDCTI